MRPRSLLITILIGLVLTTAAMPQEAATRPSPSDGAASLHAGEIRIPDLLRQFDSSLHALATRVSPAVVQITVTGFGPQDEKGKDGVSLIVKKRAIGSGDAGRQTGGRRQRD